MFLSSARRTQYLRQHRLLENARLLEGHRVGDVTELKHKTRHEMTLFLKPHTSTGLK